MMSTRSVRSDIFSVEICGGGTLFGSYRGATFDMIDPAEQ